MSAEAAGSRWYRPPEVVLLDHNYNQSVDIWSVGCTLAEMIHCSNDYVDKKNFNCKKRVLFKGKSCFPLSPRITKESSCPPTEDGDCTFRTTRNIIDENDQIIKICSKIQTQIIRDMSFINSIEHS